VVGKGQRKRGKTLRERRAPKDHGGTTNQDLSGGRVRAKKSTTVKKAHLGDVLIGMRGKPSELKLPLSRAHTCPNYWKKNVKNGKSKGVTGKTQSSPHKNATAHRPIEEKKLSREPKTGRRKMFKVKKENGPAKPQNAGWEGELG